MSRNMKNVIVILLIVVVAATMGITMYGAKNAFTPDSSKISESFEDGNKEQRSEMKSDENINMKMPDEGDGNQPEFPQRNQGGMKDRGGFTRLSGMYYIFLGVQSLTIVVLILFFIWSKGNRLSLAEAFRSKKRIIVYILSTVILTAVLTISSGLITEKCVIGSGAVRERMEMPGNKNNTVISQNPESGMDSLGKPGEMIRESE